MKPLLILTALSLGAAPLNAQQSPNRDNPAADTRETPGSPDKPPGEPGGEISSDKSPDERFIRKAREAGLTEVRIAELAVEKASRDDLKALAVTLVKDHSAANTELAVIAASLGLDRPSLARPGAQDPLSPLADGIAPSGRQLPKDPTTKTHGDPIEGLKDKTGLGFDTAFMEFMDQCHQDDIALYEKASGSVADPSLKAFVLKNLKVLKSHAEALKALKKNDPTLPEVPRSAPAPGSDAPAADSPSSP